MKDFWLLLLLLLCMAVPALGWAQATYVVDTALDEDVNNGVCSLREALTAANTNSSYNGCVPDGVPGVDTIMFDSLAVSVITLGGSELRLDDHVTIQGPLANKITVDGNGLSRVFRVDTGVNATFHSLVITGGAGAYSAGIGMVEETVVTIDACVIEDNHATQQGGGMNLSTNAYVQLINSTVQNNSAKTGPSSQGAGVMVFRGRLDVINSTLSGNVAQNHGGGIFNFEGEVYLENSTLSGNVAQNVNNTQGGGGIWTSGVLTITSSTLTDNHADLRGGGILHTSGQARLHNTLVAANDLVLPAGLDGSGEEGPTAPVDSVSSTSTLQALGGPDLNGSFTSDGFNLVTDNSGFTGLVDGVNNDQVGVLSPGLGTLSENGGATQTHVLMHYSPALDAGDCSFSGITDDQRGIPRPFDLNPLPNAGDGCDIGAFEFNDAGLALGLRLLLHGPYEEGGSPTGRMTYDLGTQGLIPLSQPFADPFFDGKTMAYDGVETVDSIIETTVDWVLVELRAGPGPETTVAQQANFLRRGGSVYYVANQADNTVYFYGVDPGMYYVVVHLRNHLAIMSAQPIALSETRVFYSFANSMDAAFGANPMIEVEPGIFALWQADGNADGQVTASDFITIWLPGFGDTGYLQADFNLNGEVTSFDFLQHWLVANGQATQVPD